MPDSTITLSDGVTTISLGRALRWTDEFGWQTVTQAVEYSLSGALIVDSATRQAGRPITLAPPDEETGLLTRPVLAQLQAWADTPGQALTLDLRGTPYSVLFRHQDGAIDGRAIAHPDHPEAGAYVLATLRFMEI